MPRILKTNLFLVGAPKAGTTTWANLLSQSHQVYVSPIKEPNFFGKDFKFHEFSKTYRKRYSFDSKNFFKKKQRKHISFVRKETDYAKLFADASEKYRLDGSSSYLFSKTAAKEIFEYNPDAKIIISLRNPIERALSHYAMLLSLGNEKEKNAFRAFEKDFFAQKKGFGISHLYIEMGLYFEQIKRYYETFPAEQILVIDFSDVLHNQHKIVRQLSDFLDTDLKAMEMVQKNKTVIPKYPIINYFKKWKKLVPNVVLEKIKASTLYEQNPKSKYRNEQTVAFLKEKLDENWVQTRAFLKEKEIILKSTI